MLPVNQTILFYDGYCALCNKCVYLALKNTYKHTIYFAPLHSAHAAKVILNAKNTNSIVLMHNNKLYYKSKAVFKLIKLLHPKLRLFLVFSFLPLSLTDFFYKIVAKYRFKLYAKYTNCPVPPAIYKHLFLN